jgi:hypothetical protein
LSTTTIRKRSSRPGKATPPADTAPAVALRPPAAERKLERIHWGPSLAASGLCGAVLAVVLHLFSIDLRVPFIYDGDALFFLAIIKGIIQGDWITHNSRLGMPFGGDLYDFPLNTNLDAVVMKAFGLISAQPGLVVNVFWLLTLLVVAGLTTYCLQRFSVRPVIAIVMGVAYAVQPFAFYRGVAHLNLVFYSVPLLATAALEIALGRFAAFPEIHGAVESDGRIWTRIKRIASGIPTYAWLGCIAQGLAYLYNSFFSCFLFIVAGLLATFRRRKLKALVAPAVLICLITGITFVTMTPSLLYWWHYGKNPAMAYKDPAQADVYALKVRSLLTPIPAHPLRSFRYVYEQFAAAHFPNEAENSTARLGTLGALGFLFLIVAGLAACVSPRSDAQGRTGVVRAAAALVISILLLANVGGLGSIFNTFVAPDIRCYNRIVVFVEFYSLLAMAILLTRACEWLERRKLGRVIPILALILMVLAAADEADTRSYIDYSDPEARSETFYSDASFVRKIETLLPQNSMVFQLPVTDFPAEGPPGTMRPYDHSRAYIHSTKYRWSWGAMAGRESGIWVKEVGRTDPPEMLRRLTEAGFRGLWIDLNGYEPNQSPEATFTDLIGSPPVRGRGGRILFYSLMDAKSSRVGAHTPEERASRAELALHPIQITFPRGFDTEEVYNGKRWHWSNAMGAIKLRNPLPRGRTVTLSMSLQTGYPEPGAITIVEAGKTETLVVSEQPQVFTKAVALPPLGEDVLSFSCNCKRIYAPKDPRSMYFRIFDLRVTE